MKINIFGKGKDSPISPHLLDYYSFLHFFSGLSGYIILHLFLNYSLLKSFIIFNILHLIYELKDFYFSYIKKYSKRPNYSDNFMELGYHSSNSYQNSIMDQIVSCIGFLFGKFCKDIYDNCF